MAEDAVNLRIRLEQRGTETFEVVVVDHFGETVARGPLGELASDGDTTAFLDALAAGRSRDIRASVGVAAAWEERAQALGESLYAALFSGDTLEALIRQRQRAEDRRNPLRIRIEVGGAAVQGALPWEVIFAKRHLVFEPGLSIVRTPDGAATEPPPIDGPLRVLVVAASPADLPFVSADREYAALAASLENLRNLGRVEIRRVDPPTFPALQAEIAGHMTNPWHVLHFIGHGDVGEDEAFVTLCDPDDVSRSAPVGASTLGQLLQGSAHLRLAVLNGCRTGQDPEALPLRSVASQLAEHHVPAVVAMQAPITDEGAVKFAQAFYSALAADASIDDALRAGREMLVGTPEWVTPIAYLRGSGRLFDVRPKPLRPADRFPAILPAVTVPRPWVTAAVADWLRSSPSLRGQHLLITGDLGAGTSVIAASLLNGIAGDDAAERAVANEVQSRWSAAHSCSSRTVGGTSEPSSFVLSVAQQLTSTVDDFHAPAEDPTVLMSSLGVDHLFERCLAGPLRDVVTAGHEVRILVDGLDDADPPGSAGSSISDLLLRLATLHPRVRLALCAPNDEEILRPFVEIDPPPVRLDLAAPANGELVDDDIRRYVVARLGAPTPEIVEQVVENAARNFLYAAHLTAQPVRPGSLASAAGPSAFSSVIDRALARSFEKSAAPHAWTEELQPLLSCLVVARAPVPPVALARWLGWESVRLASALGRYRQLALLKDGRVALSHPMLREYLLEQARSSASRAVDLAGAHRRIVDSTLALDPDTIAVEVSGDDYSLVHLPFHVDALVGLDRTAGHKLDEVAALVLRDSYVQALERSVADPVLVGRPFRDLAGSLGRRRTTDAVAGVVRYSSTSRSAAVRGVMLDVLLTMVETGRDDAAAEDLVVHLATGEDGAVASQAIHATCGLRDPSAQARVFTRIIAELDDVDAEWADERRIVAAFGLYVNGRNGPGDLLADVLRRLIGEMARRHVTRLRGQLQFVTEVTVTNYVNHCHEPGVAETTSALLRQLLVDKLHADGLVGRVVERLVSPFTAMVLSKRVLSLLNSDQHVGNRTWNGLADRTLDGLDPAVALTERRDALATMLDVEVDVLRILAMHVIGVHNVADPEFTGTLIADLWAGGSRRVRRWLLLSHALLQPTPAAWEEPLRAMTAELMCSARADDVDDVLQQLPLLGVPLALAAAKAASGSPTVRAALDLYAEVLGDQPNALAVEHAATALGIAGLYHPDFVLGALDELRSAASEEALAVALRIMAGLRPLRVRSWCEERSLWDRVGGAVALPTTRKALNILGHYNHAVYACVQYPRMRADICRPVYEYFLTARSPREWADRYAKQSMRMLRDADFEAVRWTR